MYCTGFLTLVIFIHIIRTGAETKEALVCEWETMKIDCLKGYVIRTKTAFYGKIKRELCNHPNNVDESCVSYKTLEIFSKKCDHKQRCNIRAINEVFWDPCSKTIKYLKVTYECIPVTTQSAFVCEGAKLNIKCPTGKGIWIVNAMYGRQNLLDCNTFNVNITHSKCENEDAANIMSTSCDHKTECSVDANKATFGDPCNNTHKYLTVDYQCLDQSKGVESLVCEWETMKIDCLKGYAIRTKTAFYGKIKRELCNQPNNVDESCVYDKAFEVFSKKCDHKQRCIIRARNEVFWDPCSRTIKYLQVTYECVPVTTLFAYVCEGARLDIKCPAGKFIWIVNAMYGRQNLLDCNTFNVTIRHSRCEYEYALDIMSTRCDRRKECSVDANKAIFYDPCFTSYKYLTVEYQCLDQTCESGLCFEWNFF